MERESGGITITNQLIKREPLDSETGEVVPGDHGKHHQVFIETQEKWLLVEVREHLVLFTDGEYSIDIQTCLSLKSWVIYLSKEDAYPFLHNVRVSELSLFARAWHHAKTIYRTPRPVNRQDECYTGEPSTFLFGTLPDQVDYIWFEDFKLDKYFPYSSTLLSIMDKKEVTISRKGVDDCTKMIFAEFIYCSNEEIDDVYPMFKRRLHQVDVPHKLFEYNGYGGSHVLTNYISDNQLDSFDITGQQLVIHLPQHTTETRENANDLFDSQRCLLSDSIDF